MAELKQKDLDVMVDLLLNQNKYLYQHLFNSYHQFIEEIIPYSLKRNYNGFYENILDDKIYNHGFKIEDISIRPCENNNNIIFPNDARKNHLNYFASIVGTVTQVVEIENLITGEKSIKNVSESIPNIIVASVPVMLKSKYCTTHIKKDLHGECKYDPGGYFIVNGQEKVVMSMETAATNKILVYSKKDSSYEDGYYYSAQINSRVDDWSDNLQIVTIRNRKDGVLTFKSSQFNEIPITIILRAYGIESDKDIINLIVNDTSDNRMINLLRTSLDESYDDDGNMIQSKEQAMLYLISKLKYNRRISMTNEEVAEIQRKILLNKILTHDILPHLGEDVNKKVRFIGYMINRLLSVILKREEPDNRDGFMNKRVEPPGVLLGQIFRQNWKKMLAEVGKSFKTRNKSDEKPINVVNLIKPVVIEHGIKTALSTGIWGIHKSKKGVAQSIIRLSWFKSLSELRRVMAPTPDKSTSGVTGIRMVDNNQLFFICPVETPEGAKIGIAKHLAMSATITLQNKAQQQIVGNMISSFEGFKLVSDVALDRIQRYCKIFVNGNWIGMIKNGIGLYNHLKSERRNGKLDKYTSISLDFRRREIHVWCDGGRLIRPLLRVENNKLVLDSKMIKEAIEYDTSLEINKGWNKMIMNHKDIIEYEDVESAQFLMFASELEALKDNNERYNGNSKIKGKEIINRYGENRYVKYTHCELHQWLMTGTLVSNIPFANHNYGARNIIVFSQCKQAIGIYLTSYKDRMDISATLYHPQVPIVQTQGMKYNNSLDMPYGENAVVAIMSYTGYNQEDSLIFNQSAIDRGLFRADTLKKYFAEIVKNPSTSQDDVFMKPDKSKVTGMKQGNYDKLNEKGYVEEETVIEPGDVIIGKVSPIQPTGNNDKVFKDSSTIYDSNVTGVIDRVHTGVYNSEGYELYNVRVRAERIPITGDKFCLKGDTEILTDSGWKKISLIDIRKDKVATINKNHELYYTNPSEKFEFDYDDDMFYYKNKHVMIDCTMNHKLYVKLRGKENYELIKAKDLNKRQCQVLKNCVNNKKSTEFITINNIKYKTNTFLQLVGAYISDGNVNNNKVIISCIKERKIDFCRKFLNELNIKYQYKDDKIQFINKDISDYLKNMGNNVISKKLNSELLNLSKEESRILLDSLLQGDGHTDKNGFSRYTTISSELADNLTILAFNSGYSSHIKKELNKNITRCGIRNLGERRGEFIKVTQKHDVYRISIIRKHNNAWMFKKNNPSNIYKTYHFKGKVYSIEVPESHIYYMRNDKLSPPLWIGNSNRHG